MDTVAPIGPKNSDIAKDFSERLFASIPAADLTPPERAIIATASQRLLEFASERRQPGQAAIKALPGQIFIVNDDMPFLVDSVTACLKGLGLEIDRLIHPIVPVERDKKGRLTGLGGSGKPESMMLVLMRIGGATAKLDGVTEQLATVLADVRASVTDWGKMLARLTAAQKLLPAQRDGVDGTVEDMAFLDWLKSEHFTFLGARAYTVERQQHGIDIAVVEGSGLGILRDDSVRVFERLRGYFENAGVKGFLSLTDRVVVTKTRRLATVHRRQPMDAIAVKEVDKDGHTVRLEIFIGLFSSRAYGQPARDIPLVRRKVAHVFERAGFTPQSHNGKLITQILDTYPRDELFQLTEDELLRAALQLLALEERPRFGLFLRRDQFEQFVSLIIYVPREYYHFGLRQRIEAAALKQVPGATELLLAHSSVSAGDQLGRLHLVLLVDPKTLPDLDSAALERALAFEASGWTGRLEIALKADAADHAFLFGRYNDAFSSTYREQVPIADCLRDIASIETLLQRSGDTPGIRLTEEVDKTRLLSMYRRGLPIPLSDLLPILERFGFRIQTETAYNVRPAGAAEVALQILEVELPPGASITDHGEHLPEAFDAVWAGEAESDSFNRLTLVEGLSVRQVSVLRAFVKYLRQTKFRFTQDVVETAFQAYPHFGRLFVSLFEAMHDPKNRAAAAVRAAALIDEIGQALVGVSNADDDAIFRAVFLLAQSILRTNYFQRQPDGAVKPALSLKIDSRALIALLPAPRPLVEIFVYSARLEAVHLRGGRIARGGIRWSDRREDFRTEILGLMKAQQVKNSVIVPVGSKGGFVLKRPPLAGGRGALHAEAIACYTLMMQSMLDITDNLGHDGAVLPPENVVRFDGDDPYLVVAADKGTATFSDTANSVSRAYGFWLDDAFASGGSSGYDHKGMAITARGAWESVKRHFRERGVDVQSEPVTVIGVGDMSGDVFGNGMLRSQALQLIGAFDHRHIFLDPRPDPAASFAERQRLFDLPSSSWDDYDRAVLSAGGGVFSRSLKTIDLSPEIRASLRIADERLTPAELMRALLTAPVDLLFFGGIGTYIKGPYETNIDVGDRANDMARIDGDEARATVIAEGANLAVTQAGRIAYAEKGGRLNTDFIDNSAGVDTSDHEVNIKVLLKPLVDAGKLSLEKRDALLAGMTSDVARLVLTNNYQQTQTLSRLESRAAASFAADIRFMRALEKRGHLDRAVEFLPDDEELAARAAGGEGLTRPELAVLLAYGKITAYEPLVQGVYMPAGFDEELTAYFPQALQQEYLPQIKTHALKREIVMTRVVNLLVNRAGPTFLYDMELRSGAELQDIVSAFLRVRAAFGLDAVWEEIEALDGKAPATEQTRLMLITEALLNRVVPRALRLDGEVTSTVQDRAAVAAMMAAVAAPDVKAASSPAAALDHRLNLFPALTPALDLVALAKASSAELPVLARMYVEVGRRFGLGWLLSAASALPAATDWDRRAADALIDEALDLTQELLQCVLGIGASVGAVARFAERHGKETARLEAVLTEAMAAPGAGLSLLNLVASEARRLAQAAR